MRDAIGGQESGELFYVSRRRIFTTPDTSYRHWAIVSVQLAVNSTAVRFR